MYFVYTDDLDAFRGAFAGDFEAALERRRRSPPTPGSSA